MRAQLIVAAGIVLAGCQAHPPARVAYADPMPVKEQAEAFGVSFEPVTADSPPVQLTASDGTGLELRSMQARAVLQGPLAFTELHLRFRNPEARVLEGRFEIRLPEGAAVSRFAMKNASGWQEAEVVELQKARAVYEDFLHRRQDPALLEKEAGNQFQARVFPIPANGEKELIVSYSEELKSSEPYRLALGGLPRMPEFRFEGLVWTGPGKEPVRVTSGGQKAGRWGDLVIKEARWSRGLGSDNLVLFPVRAAGQNASAEMRALLVLVDTSASRGLDAAKVQSKLAAVLAQLEKQNPALPVQIAAFDQAVVPLYSGPLSGHKTGLDKLQKRVPLGATDLPGAVAWMTGQKRFERVLLVTDGVGTAGPASLKQAARKLRQSAVRRVDCLLVGGLRDKLALEDLAYRGAAQSGLLLDGTEGASTLVAALHSQALPPARVEVDGARWVWPPVLLGLRPGEERVVYAELSRPAQRVSFSLAGVAQQVDISSVKWPLLSRAVSGANIQSLTQRWKNADPKEKDGLAKQIVKLSTTQRVLSDLTGYLVLETEQDYADFGIPRTALANVLVVGEQGLMLQERHSLALSPEGRKVPVVSRPGTEGDDGGASPRRMRASSGSAGESTSRPRPITARAPAPAESRRPPAASPTAAQEGLSDRVEEEQAGFKDKQAPAVSGPYAAIQRSIRKGELEQALSQALSWRKKEPGNVLVYVSLGDIYRAQGRPQEALRAYGSIIDLYPGRADLRRYAGCLLETVASQGNALALDTFSKAVEQRPDHPSGARMKAFALLRLGRYAQAYQTISEARKRPYPDGRFAGVDQVLADDQGLIGAAWLAAEPGAARNKALEHSTKPSLRFVLNWETDANDVDFHIKDRFGGHAYYQSPGLPSGGRLYADVTTGYGPECFNIPGAGEAGPYRLSAHYYSRGPMGFGMGKVEVIRHDGRGHLRFEQRPFVVMNDGAFVELGKVP